MGYSVYIEREEGKEPIYEEEWIDYADKDEEFEIVDGEIEATNPQTGKKFIYEADNETYYLYKSEKVMFRFNQKYITVKNPNDDIILKMLKIAKELDAIVMGDGGTIYNDTYFEQKKKENDTELNKTFGKAPEPKKSKWKFWK
ncbi:hypothetical protein [uncultured Aquimarina sp.]|uniref:hypothetical protein n=1 Tax=uncultured Aquimarina sp. TaxID=575652 RepID=UPI002619D5C0|nr:hypothetical protein [uncultured Aquimarina sp.]